MSRSPFLSWFRSARFSEGAFALATTLSITGCVIEFQGLDEGTLEDLGDLRICGGMTLEELYVADEITDDCRAALETLLPREEHTFEGRLVALGSEVAEDGTLRLFVHGAADDGASLDADAYAEAKVEVVVEGRREALDAEAYSIRRVEAGDVISLALVNDYSGSMLDADLDVVERIHTDMFTYLPAVHETEVVLFSDAAVVRQSFTSDLEVLRGAVRRDDAFERGSTALYDGMQLGLDALAGRTRPVKILMVSTDGAENASQHATKAGVLRTAADHGVVVVMLGALLADVQEMRELAGDRGVLFYTHYYSELRDQVEAYLESLGDIVVVEIPAEQAEADSVVLTVDGISMTFE